MLATEARDKTNKRLNELKVDVNLAPIMIAIEKEIAEGGFMLSITSDEKLYPLASSLAAQSALIDLSYKVSISGNSDSLFSIYIYWGI